MFLSVYQSEYNKESLYHLKYEMPLSDFLKYKSFIEVKEAFSTAHNLDEREKIEKMSKRN